MLLQLTTFQLDGIEPRAYADHCTAVAHRYAEIPGLRSKIWLAGPTAFGGVYLWQDRRWAERHAQGPLHAGLRDDPRFAGVSTVDFEVLETPTAVTRWGFSRLPA